MLKNYLKTAFRNLWKNKTYSFLNIFGLAVGITSAVMEGADTRTWRTLPDATQVVRLRLKQGEHELSLPNALGGSKVVVKIDQRYQVISLRVVGNQVFTSSIAAHVTPAANQQAMASLKQP